MQTSTEPLALLCAGFFGAVLYLRLVWMFGQAALRGVFSKTRRNKIQIDVV
jgi:hypothetical protein